MVGYPKVTILVCLTVLGACTRPPSPVYPVKVDSSSGEGATSSGDDSAATDTSDASNSSAQADSTTSSNMNSSASTTTNNSTNTNTGSTSTNGTGTTNTMNGGTTDMTNTGTMTNTGNTTTTTNTAMLKECDNKLSVGRIYQWIATTEGQMVPSSGSIVVKDGDKNAAKVKWIGNDWHVVPAWLKNVFEADVDLSKSKSFTITYSSTSDMWVQMRPSFAWDGGAKYVAKIPSSGGQVKTLEVPFDATNWTTLPQLGSPSYPYSMAITAVRGLVFVGNTPNDISITGFVIDGYEPPCN